MRLGLLGVGDAGAHHARALRALELAGEARWVAACGRDASHAAAFCERAGASADTEPVAGLDALLARTDLDAVVIATPDGLHVEHALAALERGLHVLVEKPLALDARGARAVLEAAQRAGRALAVGYHLRHHAAHALAHAELRERVGALVRIEARWAWPDPATQGWRARGDGARYWSLAALGTHLIDLALWFAGDTRVAKLSADVRRRGGSEGERAGVDVSADVTVRFANDLIAQLGTSVLYRATPRLALVGSAGELEFLGTLGARGGGSVRQLSPRGEVTPVVFAPRDPYEAQLRDFVRCARAGARPDTSDASALANVEILEQIDRAG